MERKIKGTLFGTVCLILLMLPVAGVPVILGDLEDIYIEDYVLKPLGAEDREAVSNVNPSRGSYLMLELSALSRDNEMLVFANHFLLISTTRDGFTHSSGPKEIRLCNEPEMMPAFSASHSFNDHITLDKGRSDFCLLFYLAPEVTPTQLHYLGAWPLTYPVPSKLKTKGGDALLP